MIPIVIPSAGRFDEVHVKHACSGVILCVPECELSVYREYNSECEVIAHPDSIDTLSKKRNWIIQKFGSVFMMDDDVKAITRLYEINPRFSKCTPDDAYRVIQSTADAAKQAGAYLFGFNQSPQTLHFNPFAPIQLKGFVNGCAIGILQGGGLYFNESIVGKNDFFITLLNAYKNRYCWKDNRYGTIQSFANNVGGLSKKRTKQTEREDALILRKLFGEAVQRKKTDNKSARLKSEYSLTIKLPF